jgi:ATP-dependent DNA helicase RecQ
VPGLEQEVNLRKSQIEKVLKLLAIADEPPIMKVGSKWVRTLNAYELDRARICRLTHQREAEWRQVQDYLRSETCLMEYLGLALDDPTAVPCGRCAVCLGQRVINVEAQPSTVAAATLFTKRSEVPLSPRKKWQAGAFVTYGWRGNITAELQNKEGRALSLWCDAGWGELVNEGKEAGRFADELVEACAAMILERWYPVPRPIWVTCVPSLRSVGLVPDFAQRLAARLGLPFESAVSKVMETERQRNMMNTWQQASNLDGAFAVNEALVRAGPVLLVDDIADSRWSLTVVGALLREAGSGPVFPLVLALATASSG